LLTLPDGNPRDLSLLLIDLDFSSTTSMKLKSGTLPRNDPK
jgi:hypothetical protein